MPDRDHSHGTHLTPGWRGTMYSKFLAQGNYPMAPAGIEPGTSGILNGYANHYTTGANPNHLLESVSSIYVSVTEKMGLMA